MIRCSGEKGTEFFHGIPYESTGFETEGSGTPRDCSPYWAGLVPVTTLPYRLPPMFRHSSAVEPTTQGAKKEIPSSPAEFLSELTSHLEEFEFQAKIDLPVQGLNDKQATIQTTTWLVLEDKGKIALVKTTFKPYVGELTVPLPLDAGKVGGKIPIVGPLFKFKVLEVSMDPTTRQLKGRVRYFFFTDITGPWGLNAHDAIVKRLDVPSEAKKGDGYDLEKAVPVTIGQVAELSDKLQKAYKKKGKGDAAPIVEGAPVKEVLPLWDKGEIVAEGNFSNKTIHLGGFSIQFAPLHSSKRHRFTIKGGLTEPEVTVEGMRSLEWDDGKTIMRFANREATPEKVAMKIRIDPKGVKPTGFFIPHYRSQSASFVILSQEDWEPIFRFKMEEGITMKNFSFVNGPKGPKISVDEVASSQIGIDGYGVHLHTREGGQLLLKNLHLTPAKTAGKAFDFSSQIIGEASGEVQYLPDGEEVGYLKFEKLEGEGRLYVRTRPDGKREMTLDGNLAATLPLLRLKVRSEKMAASVATIITDAGVKGEGRLTVSPEDQRVLLRSSKEESLIQVTGKKGQVRFFQNPSLANKWPELKQYLGGQARALQTEFSIDLEDIQFEVDELDLAPQGHNNGTLEIKRSRIQRIHIKGDAWGRLVARLPGGAPRIITIPESAKFKNATFAIDLLEDFSQGGTREITFSDISIDGEESKPTILSGKDQKSCGTDRQRIKARLGLFQFVEGEPDVKPAGIGPTDIVIREPFLGGCVVVKK